MFAEAEAEDSAADIPPPGADGPTAASLGGSGDDEDGGFFCCLLVSTPPTAADVGSFCLVDALAAAAARFRLRAARAARAASGRPADPEAGRSLPPPPPGGDLIGPPPGGDLVGPPPLPPEPEEEVLDPVPTLLPTPPDDELGADPNRRWGRSPPPSAVIERRRRPQTADRPACLLRVRRFKNNAPEI